MTDHTVTVTLPDHLYQRLHLLAQRTNREIPEVLLASLEATLAGAKADTALPSEVADELAAMWQFSDQELWAVTETTLSPEQETRLNALTTTQGERALTTAEQAELTTLLAEYDRAVLRRAQALALLSLRGHSIPDLNETPTR
jgi:predicted DNA-binding protein